MTDNMVRTQIQLSPRQVRALKALATTEGVSMAEMIRLAIDEMLRLRSRTHREESWDKAIETIGRSRSGSADLSENHDKHLAEVFSK